LTQTRFTRFRFNRFRLAPLHPETDGGKPSAIPVVEALLRCLRQMSDDQLFSPRRSAPSAKDAAPLIVVGLPRSGSSFLSHLISQIDDWYVFDDLYLQDKALEIGATGSLDEAQLDRLLDFLGWQIRARLRWGRYAVPQMNEDEVAPMNAALRAAFAGHGATWADLQAEWMLRLARRGGCTRWGYKQPKAFRSARLLKSLYPGARFLFLMRAPHDVLASYKHMQKGSQDGDPDQYHPLAHAYYWRMAARSCFELQARMGADVMLLRFDDLVADPTAQAGKIAMFLGAARPVAILAPDRPNTSFDTAGVRPGGRARVNGIKSLIINILCGRLADRMGFARRHEAFAPADLVDLARRSYRFLRFRMHRGPRQ
jgi:hypothetical protein